MLGSFLNTSENLTTNNNTFNNNNFNNKKFIYPSSTINFDNLKRTGNCSEINPNYLLSLKGKKNNYLKIDSNKNFHYHNEQNFFLFNRKINSSFLNFNSFDYSIFQKDKMISEKLNKKPQKEFNLIDQKSQKIIPNKDFFDQFPEEINKDNIYEGNNFKIFFSKK